MAGPGKERAIRSATYKVRRALHRSPYLTVGVVAAIARLAFVVVSFAVHDPWLIPDEGQYVELATAVADGRGAEAWYRGYGQSLYDTTRVFMVPLAFLFDVLEPSRLIGQLWAALFGVATAVGAAVLGGRLAGSRGALVAGLSVALLPSQVLWSSVVLRESLIWAALVATAIGVSNWYDAAKSDTTALAMVAGGALALGFLRSQTMLATVWALVVVAILVPRPRRSVQLAWSVAVALLVPLVAGLGPGGYELAQEAIPHLGTRRTLLSDDAESAFTATTVYSSHAGRPGGEDANNKIDSEPQKPRQPETNSRDPSQPKSSAAKREKHVIRADDGTAYLVDDSFNANLRAIPRGAVATTLRPFPWEAGPSAALRLAGIENVAWYVFYALALAGAWLARDRSEQIAFPLICSAAILAIAFVTQGNLGTAFRHRGQILWAVAVLGAVAVDHLVRAHRGRMSELRQGDSGKAQTEYAVSGQG